MSSLRAPERGVCQPAVRSSILRRVARSNSQASRRSYGTGALFVYPGARGAETWYGQWRVGRRLLKRKIGPKRQTGSTDGLTRTQAERQLRRMMEAELEVTPPDRVTVELAGQRYLRHLTSLGRRRSTLMEYESYLRVHLAPFFGGLVLDRVTEDDVRAFISAKTGEAKATKSIRNYVGFLHSIFVYGEKRGWSRGNPCRLVDLPRTVEADPDIRFLDQAELEALLRAVPDDHLGSTERVLYLTAAMTGLRQGELLGLRWRDIDWSAGKVRVRQSYVRGEFGKPKSKRSSRAVPLAMRLAADLEHHYQRSPFQGDDDLVFPHPQTGRPFDRSKLRKRFVAAVKAAGLRHVRFHDLRHTFGTRMAGAGVPLRTLQEWMGHRDFKTTLIYADYQPNAQEAEFVERAFGPGAPFVEPERERS